MSQYFEDLKRNISEAKRAKSDHEYKYEFIIRIDNANSLKKDCEAVIGKLKNHKNVVYMFKQIEGDLSQTKEALKKRKSNKDDPLALPKVNENLSDTLYVGSSVNSFETRLKLHLGAGNSKTYALHLSKWFEGTISLTVWQYRRNMRPEVLQLIEDSIAFESQPCFGKMGANNK